MLGFPSQPASTKVSFKSAPTTATSSASTMNAAIGPKQKKSTHGTQTDQGNHRMNTDTRGTMITAYSMQDAPRIGRSACRMHPGLVDQHAGCTQDWSISRTGPRLSNYSLLEGHDRLEGPYQGLHPALPLLQELAFRLLDHVVALGIILPP